MASDLKSDLVMTAFQSGPTVHLMGNPAVICLEGRALASLPIFLDCREIKYNISIHICLIPSLLCKVEIVRLGLIKQSNTFHFAPQVKQTNIRYAISHLINNQFKVITHHVLLFRCLSSRQSERWFRSMIFCFLRMAFFTQTSLCAVHAQTRKSIQSGALMIIWKTSAILNIKISFLWFTISSTLKKKQGSCVTALTAQGQNLPARVPHIRDAGARP